MCLPAYRAGPYLAQTIQSVLAQSHQDWELVVVDNASPDDTGDIARSFGDPRIVVHTNERTISLADNWNLAVSYARGRFVKVLPADDVLRPYCLELQAKQLEVNPNLALVACRRDFLDTEGNVVLQARGLMDLLGDIPAEQVVARVMASGINPIGEPAAMMFRRDDFLTVGNFDASFPFPMDLEMAIRLLRNGDFHGQEQSLAAFRVRPDSISGGAKVAEQAAEHRAVLRKVAADPRWRVSGLELRRGLLLTRVASIKRRLLFAAVTSPWKPVRRLPAYVLNDSVLDERSATTDRPTDLV